MSDLESFILNEEYQIGCENLKKGLYKEAIKNFDLLIENNYNLVNAYRARAQANKLAGKLFSAREDYLNAIKRKKDDVVSYINLGNVHYKQKHYAKALLMYNRASKFIENSSSNYESELNIIKVNKEKVKIHYIKELLEQATKEYEQKEYVRVEALTNKVIEIESNNIKAKMLLAKAEYYLNGEKEYYVTISTLKEKVSNDLSNLYELKGDIAFENKNFVQAIEYYNKALDNNGVIFSLKDLYRNRGICYYELRQYKEALFDYSMAIEKSEDTSIDFSIKFYLNQIFNHYRTNNDFQFFMPQTNLCAISSLLSIENLVYVLDQFSQIGKFDTAIEIISTVIDYDDYEESYHYFIKGKLYYESKQYEEALREFNTAIKFDNTNGDFFYFRGLTFVALQDSENARNNFVSALKLTPDNEDYKYELELINNPDLLNLQKCSRERFIQVTGLSEEKANKFIMDRNNGKQYYDIDSFALAFELQPHEKLSLEDKFIFALRPQSKIGRKIDI